MFCYNQFMRVISGTARGCKLTAPKGSKTRPTGDRMKEDLFNILNESVRGSRFLDLFCGSGAMGIEALSRGAEHAVFVDSSNEAVDSVKANLTKTRLAGRADVLHISYEQCFDRLANRFDIIFLDPPYGDLSHNFDKLPAFLSDGGKIILECMNGIETPDFNGLIMYRQKKYSQMQFLFFSRGENL